MSRPLRHALPAGFAGGLLMTLISAGAAAACPAHNPCPASAGGYYVGAYQHSSGYSETYGYEQAYVSDGYGTRGYAQEYGPYRQDYGHPQPSHPGYPPPGYGHPGYGPPAYGPPSYPPPAHGPCCRPCVSACGQGVGLVLSDSFFAGAGGVGPIPAGGYGGGYYVVGVGCGSASAYASASASASASARISIHGGYRGGHGGGHGGKGHGGGKGH
jgi:hypothetical protein